MATSLAQAWTRLRQEAAAGELPPRSPAPPSTSGRQAHPSSGLIPLQGRRLRLHAVGHPDDAA